MTGKNVKEIFQQKFSSAPLLVRSPGRVNIIGEHTDYNEGFVLPAAIDKAVYVAAGKRDDDEIRLHSVNFREDHHVLLQAIRPTRNWATYILGIVSQLQRHGYNIHGFNLAIDGDIPIGAGLSSSAAVECAVIHALDKLFELGIDPMDKVRMGQKAEHEYAGVLCGIMDQFTCMFGKKEQVIKLDCRSLHYEYHPLQLNQYSLVLFNTNVKHSLASGEYNTRRRQCEQGVALLKKHHPPVKSLRDATIEMLDKYVLPRDKLVYRRCKYIMEENQRLLAAWYDLQHGDIPALGEKMFATHEGLRHDYEVSCPELDYLVDALKNDPAVAGARMMGGGFGGCTINIIEKNRVGEIIERVSAAYKKEMQLELTPYEVNISDGTSLINV